MDAALVQRTYSRKRQRQQTACQDSFGLAAHKMACQDSFEASAEAPPASCTTGLHLDLGQANFASSTCSVCGMMYCQGQESDEKLHAAFHSSHLQGIRFQGWQAERVVQRNALSGRVLLVLPRDPAAHQRKVREVSVFLEDELGLVPGWLLSVPVKVFLYVSLGRRVVGCAVTEAIATAFPAGVATRLMDAARCHCIAGYVVPRAELAFTNPTEAGCAFARAYSQGDDFLVYK
ncbi:hypothetical protein WJX81_004119 [Elliptochloris bilobata]|uniref:N-acetyltransferase ESCO zinc-finger domain-containing protein n=1 Tax=Elliptochloris bilobata TaxID=381761 RepID=A0AAW1SD66_9CHLO